MQGHPAASPSPPHIVQVVKLPLPLQLAQFDEDEFGHIPEPLQTGHAFL